MQEKMPIKITPHDEELLRNRFSQLINYEGDDPLAPIDPATYVDSNGDSLLHIAVLVSDAEAVEIMIASHFDVNVLGDLGNTPLHYAYQIDGQRIIELLRAAGGREDIKNVLGFTPAQAPRREK